MTKKKAVCGIEGIEKIISIEERNKESNAISIKEK